MKKLILYSLLLCWIGSNVSQQTNHKAPDNWQYSYDLARKYVYNDDAISRRYADMIKKFSIKSRLPERQIANQIKEESDYNFRVVSPKGAYGPMQIRLRYATNYQIRKGVYTNLFYVIDNGELGKHIEKRISQGKPINYAGYLSRIGYNIEMGCFMMRQLIDKYGEYRLALIAYLAGENSEAFKKCKANPARADRYYYVKEIMR